MHEVPRLRTNVDRRKRAICRFTKRPVPESPPEPLQCEHCLGKNENMSFQGTSNKGPFQKVTSTNKFIFLMKSEIDISPKS